MLQAGREQTTSAGIEIIGLAVIFTVMMIFRSEGFLGRWEIDELASLVASADGAAETGRSGKGGQTEQRRSVRWTGAWRAERRSERDEGGSA